VELGPDTISDLVALAGVALTHDDVKDALREVCRISTRAIYSADGASLTTFDASGPAIAAASSEWAQGLDEMQYEEHEGPCIDAARTGMMFRVRDVGSEMRWPSYMPRVKQAGALSMLSIPMNVESKTIGALNVYSRGVDAFEAEDVSLAEIIAGHASLAAQVAAALYGHRELAEQLHAAMASRAPIEQAKGIIMAAVGCGPEEAFRRLTQQSQHENRKLREIAVELVQQQARQTRAGQAQP
jgi:GAF domain-containing protein